MSESNERTFETKDEQSPLTQIQELQVILFTVNGLAKGAKILAEEVLGNSDIGEAVDGSLVALREYTDKSLILLNELIDNYPPRRNEA